VAILIGAGVIRLLYLAEIRTRPDFASPTVDAGFHDYWARALVSGDWAPPDGLADPQIRSTPYLRPPGYPYFLAAVYYLGGTSPIVPRLAQFALGLLNVWLVYLIGRRCFRPSVGLIWAALMGCYWAFVYFEGELHATTLLDALLLTSFLFLTSWSAAQARMASARHECRGSEGLRNALLAGLCLGLAAIVRPNALFVLVAAATWMLVMHPRVGLKQRVVAAGGLCAVAALVIAPVTLRNFVVSREFVLISANGGVNLFIGNHAEADGRCVADLPGAGRFQTCFDYPAVVVNLQRRTGRELTHGEVSRWFSQRALEYIWANPARCLALLGRKFLLFWGPVEVAHNKEVQCERDYSPVLSRLPVTFPAALALAIVGAGLALRPRGSHRGGATGRGGPRIEGNGAPSGLKADRTYVRKTLAEAAPYDAADPAAALAVLYVAAWCLSVVPFFVAARYRVQVIPFLLMFAAIAVDRVAAAAAARQWRRALLAAGLASLAFVLVRIPFVDVKPEPARWRFQQGTDYARADQLDRAREHLEAAAELAPDNPQTRLALADVLRRTDRLDEAAGHLIAALTDVHPFLGEVHLALARLYAQARRSEDAVRHYAEAVRLDPGRVAVRVEFAELLQAQGRPTAAMEEYQRALAVDPADARANLNMGLLLHGQGRADEAGRFLAAALRADPRTADALTRLGIRVEDAARDVAAATPGSDDRLDRADRLAAVGRFAEAIALYRQVLSDDPAQPRIHYSLAQALYNAGDGRAAAAAYAESVRLDPEFAPARLGLGLATAALGDAAGAVEHYRKAIALDPALLAAHYNLGITLGDALERYEEAIESLEEALQLARQTGRTDLVARIEARIARFRAHAP